MGRAYSFTYYWNAQTDARGRSIAFLDGYKSGDPLQIAYRGLVEIGSVDETSRDSFKLRIAETLFAIFNDCDRRPIEYRGPSMSVGSVVEIQGSLYAVEPVGFEPTDIWESSVSPGDRRWYDGPSVQLVPVLR